MTTGDGLFWLGVFYFLTNIAINLLVYFPSLPMRRLEKIEEVLKESGAI